MHRMVLGLLLYLIYTVNGEKNIDRDFFEYQKNVDTRFSEIGILLRKQDTQLKKQSEQTQNLESTVTLQVNEIQQLRQKIDVLENESLNQRNHIQNLDSTIDSQRNIIKTLKRRQLKTGVNLSRLVNHVKCSVRKSFSDVISQNRLPLEVVNDNEGPPQQQELEKMGKDRRLLESSIIQPTSSPVHSIAFYAYLETSETYPDSHHILKFNTIITDSAGAYSNYTGAFTVPVDGNYGFLYTLRYGCNRENAFSPFELVRKSDVESVVIVYDHGCSSGRADQITVSGNAIIQARKGDQVYVRTHSSFDLDGRIFSDTHGRTSFAGWLIR